MLSRLEEQEEDDAVTSGLVTSEKPCKVDVADLEFRIERPLFHVENRIFPSRDCSGLRD